jgi:hypothetical protein
MTLAAPLAKLGRIEEAKAAAAKLLELQPGFRYGRHFAGLAVASDLAAALGDALRTTGLAEYLVDCLRLRIPTTMNAGGSREP